MCGDIHPNPGPITSGTKLNHTIDRDSRGSRSSMICMHMNARSLKKNILTHGNTAISNFHKFQEMVYSEAVDLMFVSETWLNDSISNQEILSFGYDIYRTDRSSGRSGGGVLVAKKHGTFINNNQISSIATASLEAVAIECILPSRAKWLIVCCYRPPNSNEINDLRSLADNVFPSYEKILIAGDFNFPNITWQDSHYISLSTLGQDFCDILHDYFMSQLCLQPTRDSNTLDLVISNQHTSMS